MECDAFDTPRLHAERLTREHRDDLMRMHAETAMMEFLGGLRDEAETDAYLRTNLEHWERYGFGLWILRDHDGELAGRAALRHLDVDGVDEVELGYGLLPEFWGRGLGTEIAQACLPIGKALGIGSLVAVTYRENKRSLGVLEKTGMRFERETSLYGTTLDLYRIDLAAALK